jgi:hypothetical protein
MLLCGRLRRSRAKKTANSALATVADLPLMFDW